MLTRSSWLNCSLKDDEAGYWVSVGHYEALAFGNWWYWVREDIHAFIYWTKWRCPTHWLTHWQTLKDSATQLLIKYKSEALVMQSTSGWKMLLLSRCCSCQLAATLHQIECTHMVLPPKMSLAHTFLFIFVSFIYFMTSTQLLLDPYLGPKLWNS